MKLITSDTTETMKVTTINGFPSTASNISTKQIRVMVAMRTMKRVSKVVSIKVQVNAAILKIQTDSESGRPPG